MIRLVFILPLFLFAQKPQLMLLKMYKDQNITGWVMSEKLDGMRAYWDGKHLISRGGKIIHAPSWFIKGYPPFKIDGELWTKRGDFENIVSIVRDKIPSDKWREIKHYIFEVPEANGTLFERLDKVKSYENKSIKLISQISIENKKHMQEFLSMVESKHGEGIVVRDPHANYINNRTKKVLKVKTFSDEECTVIAHNIGQGKMRKLLGSITCKMQNNVTFKIGSGFSMKERKNPPKIGTLITFKYKEFTKYGKPRFPVFLRIRSAK